MTRAHSGPPGAPQHLGPGEERGVTETAPCAPSGPDTSEPAPGPSAYTTQPRSVLTNSWGCRGTLGSIWMHFWAQGCAPPTPLCPFKSDKSVSIQGPTGWASPPLVFGKAAVCLGQAHVCSITVS